MTKELLKKKASIEEERGSTLVSTLVKKIGYARVSTASQIANSSLEAQKKLLRQAGVEKIYTECGSAMNMLKKDRPVLRKLLDEILQPGDILIVARLDRFSRRVNDTVLEILSLKRKNRCFQHLDFPGSDCIDYDQPMHLLITTIYGFLGEMEYKTREMRTKSGIEKAKAEGKYTGRKSVITLPLLKKLKTLRAQKLTGSEIAQLLGISKSTYFKALKIIKNVKESY